MKITILEKVGILTLLGVFTGCSVYHPETVSIDEGVNSQNRIKVTTAEHYGMEFKDLLREEGQLYGITGKNSETAKLLIDKPQIPAGKNVKIAFKDNEIKAVYLKNRKMSNLVNVGVPLVGAAGLIGITSRDFRPDVGN